MNEQPQPESPKPTARRFQFGMKAFFALPIGAALFFAIDTCVGCEVAAVLMVLAGIIPCSLRPATRPIAGSVLKA